MSLEKNPAAVPLNNRWIKMREMVSIGHRRIQTSWQLVGSHFCRQVSSLLNFMLQNSCNYNTAILFTFPDIFVRMLQCLKFLVLIVFNIQAVWYREIFRATVSSILRPRTDSSMSFYVFWFLRPWVYYHYFNYNKGQQCCQSWAATADKKQMHLEMTMVGGVPGYFSIWIISRCPEYFCGYSFFEFSAIFGFVIHVFLFFC
jgi:hypothetical protein